MSYVRSQRSRTANWARHCFRHPVASACLLAISLAACAVELPKQASGTSILQVPASNSADANGAGIQSEPTATSPVTRTSAAGSTKVALILPLTGPSRVAAVAGAMKQAGQLAVFDNKASDFQLIVKDSKGTAEGAGLATKSALSDGAQVIVGPLLSAEVSAAGQLARQSNVPLIAFSNDTAVAGHGTFLISFLAQQDVDRIISYATRKGLHRFAALIPDDEYGKLTEKAFTTSVARLGGAIVATERYPADTTRLLEPTQRLSEAIAMAETSGEPVEALFLPGSTELVTKIAPLLSQANVDPSKIKLLGTGAWDNTMIGQNDYFVGSWFPAPDPQGWKNFSGRYVGAYGNSPPRLAALAYDAVSIVIKLTAHHSKQRITVEHVQAAGEFTGIDGPITLLASGLPQRKLAILEVEPRGARTIDPASASAPGTIQDRTKNIDISLR